MKVFLLCIASLTFNLGAVAQCEKQPLVCVRHAELPLRYPTLARQANLQGTVILRLTIAADGNVLAAKASSDDPLLSQHSLLQTESAALVKKWTFDCFNCAVDSNYEHVLRFVYKLEGEPKSYDDTRVVLDLPNEITVTASPAQCDHCPSPAKPKRKGRTMP